MKRYLSRENISTFKGNVLPLCLLGGEPYSNDDIIWSTDDANCVQITTFKNYHNGGGFTDGVLLTFLNVGNAKVKASFEGQEYTCEICVRAMHYMEPDAKLNYYVGDMHDHTCDIHNFEDFSNREASLYPENYYLPSIEKDEKIDFALVSDHGCLLNGKDFFRGYADTEKTIKNTVIFPGAEGQVTVKEKDRYDIERMLGGEVLMLNADTSIDTDSWDNFFTVLKNSPFAFCGYPHPQIIGSSVKGIWNFNHKENNSDRFKNLFRFIEMGDGTPNHSNMINEYIYSVALDEGFHLAPTCSSDAHGPWGYNIFPGKTVIMAEKKSKEAFLDAILNNRMYATSSGNVKLFYTVNSKTAPATLENEGEYHFHVEISYFEKNREDTKIKLCQVITDGGVTAREITDMGENFDFTLSSSNSHYYYLVLIDEMGRKTWSCPVWTGKAFESKKENKLEPFFKSQISVVDNISGREVPELINDDPLTPWYCENKTADIIFDLGKEKDISALSHYPLYVDNSILRNEKARSVDKLKMLPSEYRISVSTDGENYSEVKSGLFRIFGGEEFVRFESQKARYLRLEILSTIGKSFRRKEFIDATLALAEITLWNEI